MPKYSARRAFLWQLIAKNRKRRLALHTALRTVYRRRQLLLQVACLTVLLLAFIFSVHETQKTHFHHAVRCLQ